MYSVLVVNSEDADTYGTVWYFDLANDFGIVPMYDRETGFERVPAFCEKK